MKIAIIESVADGYAGGAEQSMALFVDHLIRNNFKAYLICEKYVNYTFDDNHCEAILVVNLQPITTQGVISYLKSLRKLISFVKRHNINLAFTHTIHAFPILRFLQIFTKCTVIIYFKWIYNNSNIGFFNRWGLKSIKKIISINDFVANYWKSFYSKKATIYLVPDGIKEPAFAGNITYTENFRLLFIGRIIPGKGLHILIQALSYLPNRFILQIVGKFDTTNQHSEIVYHKFIEQLIKEKQLSDRIEFFNFQKDKDRFFDLASLVVVPSTQPDAQPLVLLEAIARKKLVIGSKVGGIPEMLGNREILLFNPNDIELYNTILAISELKNDDKLKLSHQLHNLYLEKYTITSTHKALSKIIFIENII